MHHTRHVTHRVVGNPICWYSGGIHGNKARSLVEVSRFLRREYVDFVTMLMVSLTTGISSASGDARLRAKGSVAGRVAIAVLTWPRLFTVVIVQGQRTEPSIGLPVHLPNVLIGVPCFFTKFTQELASKLWVCSRRVAFRLTSDFPRRRVLGRGRGRVHGAAYGATVFVLVVSADMLFPVTLFNVYFAV